jgi:hypothetical protein
MVCFGIKLLLSLFQNYSRAIFDIRVVDSGIKDMYLPTEVDMPLYTEPIDRYAQNFAVYI